MSTIAELVALVRAGLDEDERLAHQAQRGPWVAGSSTELLVDRVVYGQSTWGGYITQACNTEYAGTRGIPNANHIARHDPDRVLAEVAAKRSLLNRTLAEEHGAVGEPYYLEEPCPGEAGTGPCRCGRDDDLCAVLECLAAPYQERP